MGCGASKSTNVVTPHVQTGKSEKVAGRDVDRQTDRQAVDTNTRGETGPNLLGVADKPTISVSKKELPLAKPVESSSGSYLSGSEKSEGKMTTERISSGEDNEKVLVEKTGKVFITQTGNESRDRGTISSTRETVLCKEEQLERSSVIPKEVVTDKQEDLVQNDTKVDDSNAVHIDKEVIDKEVNHSKEKLQDSIDFAPEISKDTEKNVTSEILQITLDSETTEDQFVVDREDSERQPEEDSHPKKITERGEGSPGGSATPIKQVISEILGSSKSINKDFVELKSSGIKDHSIESEGLNAEGSKQSGAEDMLGESVHDTGHPDKDVAVEISETRVAIIPDDNMIKGQDSHVMNDTNEDYPGVAMTTDLDDEKKVVTIRVEVDDEFEPELTLEHSGQNLKGPVNDNSCYGNQQSSTTSKGEGSEDVMPKIHFSAENQGTSAFLLTPGSRETAVSGKSHEDMTASTGSFSRSLSWNADKQSKIEKLVNEELDVHPSIRNVSPALGFTRSVLGACLCEVVEEGEGEKEAENGDKARTEVTSPPKPVDSQDQGRTETLRVGKDTGELATGDLSSSEHDRTENTGEQGTLRKDLPKNNIGKVNEPSSHSDASKPGIQHVTGNAEGHVTKNTEVHENKDDKEADGSNGCEDENESKQESLTQTTTEIATGSKNDQVVEHAYGSKNDQVVEHATGSKNDQVVEHATGSKNDQVVEHATGSKNDQVVEHATGSKNDQVAEHATGSKNDQVVEHATGSKNDQVVDCVTGIKDNQPVDHVTRRIESKAEDHVTGSTSDYKVDNHVTGSSDHKEKNHVIETTENKTENHVIGSTDNKAENRLTGTTENNVDHVTGSTENQAVDHVTENSDADRNNQNPASSDVVANGNTHVTKESSTSKQNGQLTDQADPQSQRTLATALRFACKALPWQHIRDQVTSGVTSLILSRALRWREYGVRDFVRSLRNLKELDISNNVIGPQGFRAVCLGMAQNKTLKILNMANNLSDTESSKALGTMLTSNTCLEFLDVSGNDLGKDYFSRCVGPALQVNTSLKTLKCASCGANDMSAILEALSGNHGNRTLEEWDVSNNQLGEKFGRSLGEVLKISECSLRYLDVHATDLEAGGMAALLSGVQNNKSLVRLNAGGHKVGSLSFLMDFIYTCVVHPALQDLLLDNCKPTEMNEWDEKAVAESSKPPSSGMTTLSLAGCSLTDGLMASLAEKTRGLLSDLAVVNLSGNTDVTGETVRSIYDMVTTDDGQRSNVLESLDFSLNNAETIPDILSKTPLSKLKHFNLRKAKISSGKITELRHYLVKKSHENDVTITSLNLDSIKLSGTNTLQGMLGLSEDFAPMMPCALTSLSLSGCSVNDKDIKPLFVGIAKGLGLVHVNLSSNRLTDTSVDWLVDSMKEPCALCYLDLSNNKIRANGAEKLASAMTNGRLTHLATLLLSNNNIGSPGILALVSQISPLGTLHSLNLKDQQQPVGEEDMDEIFKSLARACDIPLDNNCTSVSTTYLQFPPQTSINLSGLGGEPGDFGPLLDSIAIQTDYLKKHKRTLNFQDALDLSAVLSSGDPCGPSLSKEDWDLVISADKDAPAWLQLSSHRNRAVYISNLPLTATREKLESLLEDDADCNVKEVILSKDPILRKPNGLAWALFKDTDSVQKAMEYYNSGQAQCFGRPFVLSPINVNIESLETGQEITEDAARQEMILRDELRKAEETEKAAIVQAKFAESSARHEYAAQNPAYADGRIW